MANKGHTSEFHYRYPCMNNESLFKRGWHKQLLTGLIIMYALNGCAEFGMRANPSSPDRLLSDFTTEVSTVSKLLDYAERFNKLPTNEQQRVFNAINELSEKKPQSVYQIKLALLLSVPDTTFADANRAQSLLANHMKSRKSGFPNKKLQQFSGFLLQTLEQRKSLDEQNKLLKQQLEELKAIEKKLNDRKTSPEPIEINSE